MKGVLEHALGIVTASGWVELAPAGRPLPLQISETFGTAADDQKSVQVCIGQRTALGDERICDVVVGDLPPRPRASLFVTITLVVDEHAVLRIKTTVGETGDVRAFGPFSLTPAAGVLTARVVVEERSPAIAAGRLVALVGVEVSGGAIADVLPAGAAVPCARTERFSNAAADQRSIEIRLWRGGAHVASAHFLGAFVVEGFAGGDPGAAAVDVSFAAVEDRLELSAWDRRGGAVTLRRSP